MMTIFEYPRPAALDGDQLAREIGGGARVYVAGDILRVVGEGLDAQAVAAVIAAHVPVESDLSRARSRILSVAQSAVGADITTLTAAQQRALLAALLFKAGAINAAGIVQPLAEWL